MLGFMGPSASRLLTDDFLGTTLSMRNARKTTGNRIRNSAGFMAAGRLLQTQSLGQPAPMPENWYYVGSAVLPVVVGNGRVTNGGTNMPYVDIRLNGTAGSGDTIYIAFEDDGAITTSVGQTWTISGWISLSAGVMTNISGAQLTAQCNNGSGALLASFTSSITITGTPTRFSATGTVPAGTTGYMKPFMNVTVAAAAINATFRIAGVQVELAGTAGTYVETNANDGNWSTTTPQGPNANINLEEQYYPHIALDGTSLSNGINPFSVANSLLSVTGRLSTGGANGQPYVSGCLTTWPHFARSFGYYEWNARFPGGNGWWLGLWAYSIIGGVNGAAEIDFLEHIGIEPTFYHTNVHSYTAGGAHEATGIPTNLTTMQSAFHTYGVDWRKDRVDHYLDQKFVGSMNPFWDTGQPMYVILQLAMGGSYAGPMDLSKIPGTMDVDYINVWDKIPF